MSYYEQYLAVRSDSPDDYQQMFPKVPLLINAALDLAEGVAR